MFAKSCILVCMFAYAQKMCVFVYICYRLKHMYKCAYI